MAFFFKLGGIYNISYSAWKTNPTRIYVFILFGNPVLPKVHALNLGAKQLSMYDKAKIIHTIVRLSKIPNISTYSGRLLYRIFLTYLKPQIGKCYRTYFHQYITRASLINYGINKKEDFGPNDLKVYNPNMLNEAKRDFLVRILNMYSKRGVELHDVQASLAKIQAKIPTQPGVVTPTKPNATPQTPTKPSDETQTPGQPTPEKSIEEQTQDSLDKIGY